MQIKLFFSHVGEAGIYVILKKVVIGPVSYQKEKVK